MKTQDPNQLNMFEVIPGMKIESVPEYGDKIAITKVHFISQETTTYHELFSGYNELRVITFSYGVSFVEKIMKLFDRGEVIIGYNKMINKNTADLFALQEYATNYVCKNAYLQKRIQDDEFRFFVLSDLVSHQKIYLLKADDGRVRTIMGSANFTETAWTGEQIENVTVCDDPECYEVYAVRYETLKRFSTDEIAKDAKPIKEDCENADEFPIFKKVEAEHAVVLHDSASEEEKEYVFHAEKLDKEWEERLKEVKIKPDKDGKILVEIKHMKTLLNCIRKDNAKKRERQMINPQFIINYDEHSATYNQKQFDLNPLKDDVISDLKNLIEYMDGFSLFTKDTTRLKTLYWKVLNYVFLSPFIAKLRYDGNRNGYQDRFFPMYMLIYGDSDAGKTGFINLARQMMFQEKLNSLTQDFFSSKPMTALKADVKGCPILIDELTPTYWKYAKDIVKMDVNLIKEHLINHPTFILLSNDINNVAPELSKRIIVINLDNRLDRTAAAYNGKKINTILKNVTNALYREYLRRMFMAVDQLVEEMQAHDEESKDDWIPDIFSISSQILLDIMQDFSVVIPEELHVFTWFDYMGDTVIGEKSTGIIIEEYEHNSKIFHVDLAKNSLEIDFSCYDDNETKKKLRILHDELPASVECKIIGTKAVMKLDAIRKHSGIDFKKRSFWRRK